MSKILPTAFVMGAALAATVASAADTTAAAAPTGKRAEWRQQMFDKIDANRDGTISRAEYQAWVDDRFAKLDSNGDGIVDADEVASSPTTAERVQKRADGFVRRYDTSGDGKVTKADFEAKEMQRFDRLSDGADSITPDQLAAARPFKRRHAHDAGTDNGG